MIKLITVVVILGWAWTGTVGANPCEGSERQFERHENCTMYYSCVNGVAHPMTCPSQYPIFNLEGQMCDAGNPDECVNCPAQGVHRFPVPNTCDRFILCVSGVQSQDQCPTGLQFDHVKEQCNLASVVGCAADITCSPTDDPASPTLIPHPHDCTVYFICVAGEPIKQVCPEGTEFNGNHCDMPENAECPPATGSKVNFPFPHYSKASVESEKCSGNVGIKYIPDSEDCMYYYMCMNDKAVRYSCEKGLIFDEELLKCDNPESAVCIRDKAVETNPCLGNTGVNYTPHPSVCSKYYLCMTEMKYEVSCPDDSLFDSISRKCQSRSKATCYSQQTISKEIGSPCIGNQGVNNFPHESDCTQFYMCMVETEHIVACPDGNLFDTKTNRCQTASEATCYSQPSDEQTTTTSIPTTTVSNRCAGNQGVNNFPHEGDCTQFYMCMVETEHTVACPEGNLFDIKTNRCQIASEATCYSPSPDTTTITTITPSTTTVATTTDTQHISEAPTPSPATSPIPTAPTPGSSTVPPPPPSSTMIPTVWTTPSTNPPGLFCAPDSVYYRPHPICSKFYRCVYGKLYELDCPQNQHWNQAREYCDHIWNVSCTSQ
ncbi:uncharacterized protein LOC129764806 [Toxorhynchites rutilus septentrionalis]|uniref:uncharacterized protein LOC129764806 n=1 Tax=Toxorhynchites rutilus septentrionalis TaxID=329112 RepID=UPI002479A1EC|nr:uncharacterized protein LOC129764806 [Toxorhynchites rutilus septentrionalis]